MCVVMLLTFVRLAPVDADFDGETTHAGHHAIYDAAAMIQDAVDPNLSGR